MLCPMPMLPWKIVQGMMRFSLSRSHQKVSIVPSLHLIDSEERMGGEKGGAMWQHRHGGIHPSANKILTSDQ
jgi:hypothetical protein